MQNSPLWFNHPSGTCTLAFLCVILVSSGLAASAAHEGDLAEPSVKISVANSLKHSSKEYGQHDAEFLKGNVVEVRPGHVQVYFSRLEWTEQPEQQTITLLIEVIGYDMGARFKNFEPDAARPCVKVQMPHDSSGDGDAEICGKSSFSFNFNGERIKFEPLYFHATLLDARRQIVSESDLLSIQFLELPSWKPSPLELTSLETRGQGSTVPAGGDGSKIAVTFLADEKDIDEFLHHVKNWRASFGRPCASCAFHHADPSSSSSSSNNNDGRGRACTGECEDAEAAAWALHVFVAVEALHAHQHLQSNTTRPAASSSLLHAACTHLPCHLHVLPVSSPSFTSHASAAAAAAAAAAWPGARRRMRKTHFLLETLLQVKQLPPLADSPITFTSFTTT
jgi:hypothetical protein